MADLSKVRERFKELIARGEAIARAPVSGGTYGAYIPRATSRPWLVSSVALVRSALGEEWTPEHLLLVALVDCSLTSLRYHARRAAIEVDASGSASGVVTKRASDERYAFVEIDVELDVSLAPRPSADELEELLAKAERDCFIAASLTVKPSYAWRVAD